MRTALPAMGSISLAALGLALVLAGTGCGSDPFQRQPVQGNVKFAGKPIQYGTIRLEPAEKQPAGASGSIRDGKFKIERSAGVGPGKYKVWVQAFDKAAARPGRP